MNRLSHSLYSIAMSNMPHGVIIVNTEGRHMLWNKSAEEMFPPEIMNSGTREKWIGSFEAYTVDKKIKYDIDMLPISKALKGTITKSEKMFVKTGEYPKGMYLRVSAYPLIEDGTLKAAVAVFEDITDEQVLFDDITHELEEIGAYLKDVLKVKYPPVKIETNETQRAY